MLKSRDSFTSIFSILSNLLSKYLGLSIYSIQLATKDCALLKEDVMRMRAYPGHYFYPLKKNSSQSSGTYIGVEDRC